MKGHSFGVDWWTLGILTYELKTGRPPFLDKNHHKLGKLIKKAKIIFPDPIKHKIEMSEEMKDFITRLLDRDPSRRLGNNGADEIMSHPWFADLDFKKLLKKKIRSPYIPSLKKNTGFDKEAQELRSTETIIGVSKTDLIGNNKDKFADF